MSKVCVEGAETLRAADAAGEMQCIGEVHPCPFDDSFVVSIASLDTGGKTKVRQS